MPVAITLEDVEVWFQDEARVGQQGSLTRTWAVKGTRPRLVRQQQFLSSYIFGAVCPEKDKGAAIISPYSNTQAMNAHLQEIACHIEDGKHAVVVLDCAGWHISRELRVPSNMTLVPLPPYSPELNPQELVWQVLKDRDLKNRTFRDDNDILDACCKAWNAFVGVPNAIKTLCSRQWAVLST